MRLCLPTLALFATVVVAVAQTDSKSPFTATAFHRFSTDLDAGGDVSSQTYYARAGAPLVRGDDRFLALSLGYGIDVYDFGGGVLGSPWGDVHRVQLSAPMSFDLANGWSLFGLPSVRSTRELDADFGDSITGGAILGGSRRINERLTLGPGVGFQSQLEDDVSVFPALLIDYRVSDALSLTTGPTIGATLGPGLSLNYTVSDTVSLSLGARYEKLRFRLDDGGVGEDRTIPLFGAVTFSAGDHWRMSLLGGVDFGRELSHEDGGGRTLAESDADPAPFVGLHAGFRF